MYILVIGSNGYIGQSLVHQLRLKGHMISGMDLHPLDLAGCSEYQKRNLLIKLNHRIISHHAKNVDLTINLAGIVGFNAADEQPEWAETVNAEFPAWLPNNTLHISAADSIYGDQKDKTHVVEDTLPNPQSHYGKTKLKGEEAVLRNGGKILRLSSVFGVSPYMRWDNLIHNWIKELATTNKLEVFEPQTMRSFTYLPQLIECILDYIDNFDIKPNIQNVCNLFGSKITIAQNLGVMFPKATITTREDTDPEKRNYIVNTKENHEYGPYEGNIRWWTELHKPRNQAVSSELAYLARPIKKYYENYFSKSRAT